jgi:hypothetical protein
MKEHGKNYNSLSKKCTKTVNYFITKYIKNGKCMKG